MFDCGHNKAAFLGRSDSRNRLFHWHRRYWRYWRNWMYREDDGQTGCLHHNSAAGGFGGQQRKWRLHSDGIFRRESGARAFLPPRPRNDSFIRMPRRIIPLNAAEPNTVRKATPRLRPIDITNAFSQAKKRFKTRQRWMSPSRVQHRGGTRGQKWIACRFRADSVRTTALFREPRSHRERAFYAYRLNSMLSFRLLAILT